MRKNYLFTLLLVVISSSISNAQTAFIQWPFENNTTTSIGSGTSSLIGGATADGYVAGVSGQAYNIQGFTPAGAPDTAGFEFQVSTVGYDGITVSFDVKGNNQASKWQHYLYSADGGITWNNIADDVALTAAYSSKSYVLPVECENNSDVRIRIVSTYGSISSYEQVQGGGPLANGRWSIDNMTFSYNALSTNTVNNISGLKVYPNPAKASLFITSDNAEVKQVAIYNMLGKVVLSTKATNAPINVSALSSGVYVVKVTEEGKTATRRIVVE